MVLVYVCFFFALLAFLGLDDALIRIADLLVMASMALVASGVIS